MSAFEVYRTSAGAGKTYTIAREFIRFCLTGKAEFDAVAAVTFTNKAANEMKDRIIEYLFAISEQHFHRKDIAAIFDDLLYITGFSREKIIAGCKSILQNILHNYSRFTVVTIDSFIHDILRIFSHDLHLPDNFTVEIDTDMLADMVVEELLTTLEANPDDDVSAQLTNYILDLVMSRFEEKENWDITFELKTYAQMLFTEDGMNFIQPVAKCKTTDFSVSSKQLYQHCKRIEQEIQQYGKEALNAMQTFGITANDLFGKSKGIYSFFQKASEFNMFDELKINNYAHQAVEEDKWSSGKKEIPSELKTHLQTLYGKILNHSEVAWLPLMTMLRSTFGPMALLGKMQQILNEYKIQNQVIPISEFNKYIADVIRNEPAPFIYERLGQKYRHFLIDEFQDTSIMQWQNFLPLIENSLAQDKNILIVGDVKQAIYRFRNGEMEQLMKLPEIYKKPEQSAHFDDIERLMKLNFTDKAHREKNINFRSGQHIVEVNNEHFQWIWNIYANSGRNNYVSSAYEHVAQNFSPQAAGKGYVAFHQIDSENYSQSTLEFILKIIQSYPKKGDIAILVRNNNAAKKIAAYLMQQNPPIPVISSESLELSFSPTVNFIIDMLKFIHHPTDTIAITGAYTYLYYYKSELRKRHDKYHTLLHNHLLHSDAHTMKNQFVQLLNSVGYAFDLQYFASLTVNEIVSKLISEFSLAPKPDAYILFFQNKLNDLLKTSNESLTSVLKWWDETGKKISIIIPEGTDAVRIMSIHKSKGLQFPVVIYPFADFILKKSKSFTWVPAKIIPDEVKKQLNLPGVHHLLMKLSVAGSLPDSQLKEFLKNELLKQELDTLNIHYVAMTRAKQALHIISKKPKTNVADNAFKSISELIESYLSENKKSFSEETINNITSFYRGVNEFSVSETASTHQLQLAQYYVYPENKRQVKSVSSYLNKEGRIGELFHQFISSVVTLNTIPDDFEKFCIRHAIPNDERLKLGKLISQFTDNQIIQSFYTHEMIHLNETTIIEQEKVFRPDKVVYNDTQTCIIDFKTGKKLPKHKAQIENYKRLLNEMGYQNISALLVYITESSIEIEPV